jgi:hypothetical protein
MKNPAYISIALRPALAAITLSLSLIIFTSAAADLGVPSPEVSKKDITISGCVYDGYKLLKKLTVYIYRENDLIDSVQTGKSSSFKIDVPLEEHYTIEIRKRGYDSKFLVFDTHTEGQKVSEHKFVFEVELYRDIDLVGVDTAVLDFPAGIVAYNEEHEQFLPVVKYGNSLAKDYDKLLFSIEIRQQHAQGTN